MTSFELTDWTLQIRRGAPAGLEGPVPATVPGCVHTDLMAAGLLDDPFVADREASQHWIGLADASYQTDFELPVAGTGAERPGAPEQVVLCLDGVDTIAAVSVNDQHLADLRNMHRRHRIDITAALTPGSNRVRVDFDAPVRAADAEALRLGLPPHVNNHPYNAIRKMACSFGWDWGPDTATSGLWRPARIEVNPGPDLDALWVHAHLDEGTGRIEVRLPEASAHWQVEVDGPGTHLHATPAGDHAELTIDEPQLWWPTGHGDQPRYTVTVTATDQAGRSSTTRRTVGFRTVEWQQPATEQGQGFQLQVNGAPVWVKGVNWIPDDPFPHRSTPERVRERLVQALGLGCNLVRVWGGGVYESDVFYEICDELGLLVWQDFAFACAFYPEAEPLRSEVEAEVADNLARLRHHPSLVLLNGGNETEVMGAQQGWQQAHDQRDGWGLAYWREWLPSWVEQHAPWVTYIPNSPFSPDPDVHPNDPNSGTMHIWDLWNSRPYPDYRTYRPAFAAEFGWQAPPAWTTLTDAVHDDPLTPDGPQLLVHQKAGAGQLKLQRGLVGEFGAVTDMTDWHWGTQLVQARALRTAVEWFRSLAGDGVSTDQTCGGSIIWQLNDCWPVVSWAVIDSAGRLKPAAHALAGAHQPRLATLQPDGGLVLALSNLTAEPWQAVGQVELLDVDGELLASQPVDELVTAWTTIRVAVELGELEQPERQFARARIEGSTASHHFARPDHLLELPTPEFDLSVDADELVLTARSLLRDVCLLPDLVNLPEVVVAAGCPSQLSTLLPGEQARWPLPGLVDAEQARAAVRTANQLVQRRA